MDDGLEPGDKDHFGRLLSWTTEQGGFLHPRVEIYRDKTAGFGLRVRPGDDGEGTRAGEALVSCTMAMSLSYLNAVSGDGPLLLRDDGDDDGGAGTCPQVGEAERPSQPTPAFPARFMEETPPHVAGRFFLVQQYLLGRQSFWSAYIDTLPQPEHASRLTPPFWPREDAELLGGTNAGVALDEIRHSAAGEFKTARKLLAETGFPGWQGYSRPLYNWAYAVFASRSFRPSQVLSDREVRELSARDGAVGVDDFSMLLPLLDIPNHSPIARVAWDVASSRGAVQLRTADAYAAGQQIFNNYGLKTNSELLVGYGFILPETQDLHNDYVHVRTRDDSKKQAAEAAAAAQPGNAGGARKPPQDSLISLRPLSHPSSVVGHRRQFGAKDGSWSPRARRPAFDFYDDALLWDLCLLLANPDEQRVLGMAAQPRDEGNHCPEEDASSSILGEHEKAVILRRVFAESPAPDLSRLAGTALSLLFDKLARDYSTLVENEPEVGQEDMGRLTPNQRLALDYRRQCRMVLANALKAIDPDVELVG